MEGRNTMADAQGEETLGFNRNREANIATAAAIVVIAGSFGLEALPLGVQVIIGIAIGLVVLVAIGGYVVRQMYLSWLIEHEINRPLTVEEAATAALLKRHRGQAPSRE